VYIYIARTNTRRREQERDLWSSDKLMAIFIYSTHVDMYVDTYVAWTRTRRREQARVLWSGEILMAI